MKRLVVLGIWCAFVGFAACGSESRSLHRGGDDGDGSAGDEPGGQGPGGESAGGTAGSGAGAGGGGISGTGGSGIAGTGFGGGGASGGSGGTSGSTSVPCGALDCLKLPHVRPDAQAECRNGMCILGPDACEEGYAHCSAFQNEGCEADLRATNTCGDCDTHCFGSTPACTRGPDGLHCSTGCDELTPDRCTLYCTNFENNVDDCGGCGNQCSIHAEGECVNGECRRIGPCESGYGDCTEEVGCETMLTTPENCGACGRDDCGAANAVAECSSASGCVPPACAVGFANCDRTSVDCEAHGTTCFPTALAPIELPIVPTALAIIDGGALFTFGSFSGSVDFDASAGSDIRSTTGDADAYVTRYDANGAYAWTRTFGGSLEDRTDAAGVGRDGTLLVSGNFFGTTDLDPGSGVDQHVADTNGSGFVSKLTAAGSLVWARDLRGQAQVERLAGDATGAVYASGTFDGTIDLDPGPAMSLHTAEGEDSAFLVKFDASGNFVWDRVVTGSGDSSFTGLAVAADSSVWIAGRHSGQMSLGGRSLGDEPGMFFAGFEPSGALRTIWLLGDEALVTNAPSVGAGTNVYVEGGFYESLDMDPGAGTEVRQSLYPGGYGSGFLVGLGLDGTYRHAHVVKGEPLGIHETPGGGSLLFFDDTYPPQPDPNVVAYYSDGTPAWTLSTDTGYYGVLVASNTHFAMWGVEDVRSQSPLGVDERSFNPDDEFVVRRYAF